MIQVSRETLIETRDKDGGELILDLDKVVNWPFKQIANLWLLFGNPFSSQVACRLR